MKAPYQSRLVRSLAAHSTSLLSPAPCVRARARHDTNLNETLSRIFADIEGSATGSESEDDFKGLFDDLDMNSPTVAKRNKKLVKQEFGSSGNTILITGH